MLNDELKLDEPSQVARKRGVGPAGGRHECPAREPNVARLDGEALGLGGGRCSHCIEQASRLRWEIIERNGKQSTGKLDVTGLDLDVLDHVTLVFHDLPRHADTGGRARSR